MYVAQLTDRNGSTFYTTACGSLTRRPDKAEQFFTREMAELYATPSFNGIPSSRISTLEIRGQAVPVEA